MDCAHSKERLKELICGKTPLIEGYIDLDQQLQPNGFDLSLRQVDILQTPGQIATDNSRRLFFHRSSAGVTDVLW